MKHKQQHFTKGSFALLFLVILGYTVKFYPAHLSDLDQTFQLWLRGDLPEHLTAFFRGITLLGDAPIIFAYVGMIALFCYLVKAWRAESFFLLGNLGLMTLLSTGIKYIYNRPRPAYEYLIEDPTGPSFPSWHTASTMLVALLLVIIIEQRLKQPLLKRGIQALAIGLAIGVALSRIYLGVHYPTDILGGWALAIALVCYTFPFYDQKRFEWRFQSKQK